MLFNYIYNLMFNRKFLVLLLISNFLGTVYGYIWYGGQLSVTPWYFYPFVPDSPTATLFLCVLIVLILFNKHSGLVDALAFTTLIKYGVWAVIMNIWNFIDMGFVSLVGLMLIASHLAMAIQAFLFLPHMKIKIWHFGVTALWLFHNDVIDYVFMQYPRYGNLHGFANQIGYLAFWLTIIVLILLWKLVDRRNN
ncbi:DUF1405 domain-containing protein [Jeotgalicoccus sp. ATCC 8456]|uniref:DUF1405 domain-containing protein n=2 Tax=unclassified Jeotgalicoccus TaxID=2630462 RepID=UPI0014151C4E|nr:DUF1405 domain-containing protein [Jeotgalicoccus sp. ATCC 8456]QQD85406.1 DUF1405 domain-containing protein [Jeotgalicoccus sp. ATCC 8456]